MPQILKKSTKVKFPKEFEFLLLIFVVLTLILGKIQGILAPILFGIGTGLIALLIMFILYSSNQIKRNSPLILLFAFNFALAFGVIIELLKYYLKLLLNQNISQSIYSFTMMNLTYVLIGGLIATLIGFLYLKTRFSFITKILKRIKSSNPELFKKSNSLSEVIEEIKQGETENQEFKSTLRTNLHTKEKDKNIENAILKTIVAFLNSHKGTLYIGITDQGKILGIQKDNFENSDKFHLHFTNLVKQKIGKKNLRLIESKIIPIKDRHIFRIEIKPSKSPVFLRQGKEEEFYIRAGPSSTQIAGSELLDYVKKKFDKKR
jgi:hypothetical protein